MFERVRRLFVPYRLKDDEQTRIAGLLFYILVATIVLNIINIVLLLVSASYTIDRLWINSVILILQFSLLANLGA